MEINKSPKRAIFLFVKGGEKMNIKNVLISGISGLIMFGMTAMPTLAAGGFDQYGYNDSARVFNGTGSSWCLAGGQAADCVGVYSQDKLVMKWNAAWDACNANGYDNPTYCLGATLTNEWNGMIPGGSGDTEHFKAIWVGSLGESSPYWQPGGYLIWGNYEAIMDQGMVNGVHMVWAHATPNGFGASK